MIRRVVILQKEKAPENTRYVNRPHDDEKKSNMLDRVEVQSGAI
jgi:hypothetical protein